MAAASLARVTPADTFHLAAQFRHNFPQETASMGTAGGELDTLIRQYPAEVNLQRISRDFGTPHPVLAQNYACELLNLQPFPAFGGNSSRLLGESWDSTNLYWARLADEKGYSPVMLNRLVPELTRRMVANIFATDIEDWLALTRAMKETGEEFRQGKIVLPQLAEAAVLQPGSWCAARTVSTKLGLGRPQINGIQDRQWQSDIFSSSYRSWFLVPWRPRNRRPG